MNHENVVQLNFLPDKFLIGEYLSYKVYTDSNYPSPWSHVTHIMSWKSIFQRNRGQKKDWGTIDSQGNLHIMNERLLLTYIVYDIEISD